jgi:hypothetical protein
VNGYAAVPRASLGLATPPLCRYAVHTKRRGSKEGRDAEVENTCQHTKFARAGRRCTQRSGIKEEAAALGRNGGQPRS